MTTDQRNGGAPGDADRDPRLDHLYRDIAREEPPASLDAAILAAARREVGARPRAVSAYLRVWRVPVSIAAVVVVSASLVTLVREEGGGQLERPPAADRLTPPAAPAPAPPPAPAWEGATGPGRAQKPPVPPAAKDDAARGAMSSAKVAEEAKRNAAEASAERSAAPEAQSPPRDARRSAQPFQEEPPAGERRPGLSADQARSAVTSSPSAGAPEGGADSASKPAPATGLMRGDPGAASDTAGALSSSAPATAGPAEDLRFGSGVRAMRKERVSADPARLSALIKEFGPQPPEKWLEKIEALKRDGSTGEAEALLVEFKRRFPGHPLPPGLR